MSTFHQTIKECPPALPISLQRSFFKSNSAKLKVSLRICNQMINNKSENENSDQLTINNSQFQIDFWKKQLFLYNNDTSKNQINASKSCYNFDSIYTIDDYQIEICSSILASNEIFSSILKGIDSCIFSFGSNNIEKSRTMFGSDDTVPSFGLIPLTTYWLFKLIENHRIKHEVIFTVRISIVEILEDDRIFDLIKNEEYNMSDNLKNLPHVKVCDPEKALLYLDISLNNRKSLDSHLVYCLHVHQYGPEGSKNALTNLKNRLCLVDYGNQGSDLIASINQLDKLLMDSNCSLLGRLLEDFIGVHNCKIALIAHILDDLNDETLKLLEFTSKIQKRFDQKNSNNSQMKLIRNLSVDHHQQITPITSSTKNPSKTSTPSRIKLGVSTINNNSKNNEIWVDGPKSNSKQSPVNKILTPGESINFNEIWIDGPNVVTDKKLKRNSKHKIGHTEKLNSYFNSIKDLHFETSEECSDRALLQQLNNQDADIVENLVFNTDCNSRPISLLSVNSTETYSTATNSTTSSTGSNEFNQSESNYIKKLEDLKTSYDQMIFKQSFEPMESLHKTLESILSLDQHQFKMQAYKSNTLAPARDLVNNFERPSRMTNKEKEKRLSRILSPTRLKNQNFEELYSTIAPKQASPVGSIISSGSSVSTSSSATPPSTPPGFYNDASTKNRLFFNFNTNNGLSFQNSSTPNTPSHSSLIDSSGSVSLTPNLVRKSIERIKINGQTSDNVFISEGVKQGGILAPYLFNFFINDLIKNCTEKNIGAKINNIQIPIIAYCDDIILIAPSFSHCQILISECEDFANNWKLEFNASKSVAFTFFNDSKFILNGKIVPNVSGFIYLGLPIGNQSYIHEFLENKWKSVEKALYSLYCLGCKPKMLNPFLVSFLFKTYCQSIFKYVLDNVFISESKLKEFEIRQNLLVKH
ncbi:unnamed protein product [Brachionus calyciflorus]|uniref:Reverse transcriptase domain-containing protein n=1 Tax=Brachionus calyciflorus TaxID=104777 RepID=A0A813MUU8_9BILA|nr:unnamed protein product [Brachionus calyciflorus]